MLDPLRSDRPLIAYFDIKSPYAYLAKDPTRELAAQLGIQIDWRPFTLDIPSYLGSARLDKGGKVAQQSRSTEQWSGIKYAYFDCRRYANLRDIRLRGTVKIWDSRLVSIGMLWARAQGDAVLDSYLDVVYVPFWKRELDVESLTVVEQCLQAAGAPTDGFAAYAEGEGGTLHDELQLAAFDAGVYGVPTYIVGEHRYFGREHLPRIRWHLTGERGAPPPVAYEASGPIEPARDLTIWIDFNSLDSLAAIGPIQGLLQRLPATIRSRVEWCCVELDPPGKPPATPARDDRAGWHRVHRSNYQDLNRRRYAPTAAQDIYARLDTRWATAALHWASAHDPDQAATLVQRLLEQRFLQGADLTQDLVRKVLTEVTEADASVTLPYPDTESNAEAFSSLGFRATPAFVLDEEPFAGLQHLPLIARRLLQA